MENLHRNKSLALSIIVPVYRAEESLRRCVDSILSQTFADFELILVDDGSPDNCPQMCDGYAKKDKRVKVTHQANMGGAAAVTRGITLSEGKFIGFVDSDDWIEPEMYRNMLEAAVKYNADMVKCGSISHRGKKLVESSGIDRIEVFEGEEILSGLLERILNPWLFWKDGGLQFPPSRCNKLMRSDLTKKNQKYWDSCVIMGPDLVIMLSILLDCRKVVCLPESYYHIVGRNFSTTRSYHPSLWESNKRLFKAIDNICKAKKINAQSYTRKHFNYKTVFAIYNEYRGKDGFWRKASRIINICRENPAQQYLGKYNSRDFVFLQRLIIRLMILKLYFLIPVVLEIYQTARRIKTFARRALEFAGLRRKKF
jgi:glycosyltransferase involved in cell wall biosynthesis